jgi:hypothetical protein
VTQTEIEIEADQRGGFAVAQTLRQLFADILRATERELGSGLTPFGAEVAADRFKPAVAAVIDMLPEEARAEFAAALAVSGLSAEFEASYLRGDTSASGDDA